ncbi:hypothetical protein KIH75_03245 [Bifidobacterium sp. 64T4]|uniref:hypothetical protein n=1 Tax=Bifidobacterium pongonis TaxID=2834432 RepID=UPI001C58E158|nr:hypothetical protein [Bifidobacterium pongonis]MBW3094381.1 hypothetical protein [Bifidobacterium pongonis]
MNDWKNLPADGRGSESADDGNLRVVMLVCTLLTAIDSAIELFAAPVPDWHTPVIEAVLLTVMAVNIACPVAGSVLLGVAWCVAFPMPISLSMSLSVVIVLPLIVLSYRRTAWGVTLMAAAMVSRIVQLRVQGAFTNRPMWWRVLTATPWLVMPFVIPVMAGVLLRWWHIRRRRAEEASRRAEAMAMAARLHDSTTNELSYLIMDIDHFLQMPELGAQTSDTLRRMRATAGRALKQTHDVIAMLRDGSIGTAEMCDDSPRGSLPYASSKEGAEAMPTRHRTDSVRYLVERYQRDAATLGMTGETVVTDSRGILDHADAALGGLIRAVIQEMFANIMKHAEPAAGYVLAVAVSIDEVCISCADVPRRDGNERDAAHDDCECLGMGFGIDHLRVSVEARGGRVEIHGDAGHWSCMMILPLMSGYAKSKTQPGV